MKGARLLFAILITLAIAALSGAQGYDLVSDKMVYDLNNSSSPQVKVQAMNALSMRADPRARDAIYQSVNSPYLNVRLNALRALGRYHYPADLKFLETVILDYEGQYTVQERIVAVKSYVNIDGWNPAVLEEARILALDPIEKTVIIKGSKVIWTFSPHIYAAA